ncbi:unnamed protein product [Vitrella brassicaformis CCMP3155]|uniref:proton-translocating NAD(P)(+) transhydrogenase n=1 Tax=Vitrella brassicaformis (strain CCMP3155) TaxID=1169540 RepID=A0A0G4G369_VITBC|nr:unnamed protein product [Vitrella brassicaformis CCMP3155]|eukprot:CEM22243.1 unnamed protein product [Vitrella brassicaformis CCMP3155]
MMAYVSVLVEIVELASTLVANEAGMLMVTVVYIFWFVYSLVTTIDWLTLPSGEGPTIIYPLGNLGAICGYPLWSLWALSLRFSVGTSEMECSLAHPPRERDRVLAAMVEATQLPNHSAYSPLHCRAPSSEAPPPAAKEEVPPVQPIAVSRMPSLLMAVYIFSAVCFIAALYGLSHPSTAMHGNIVGMVGMAAAILVTFTEIGFGGQYVLFFLLALPGFAGGVLLSRRTQMTQTPQLIAGLHATVGLAAMLVAFGNLLGPELDIKTELLAHKLETYIGEFIAAVTFAGSVVACGKLTDLLPSAPLSFGRTAFRHATNALMLLLIAGLGVAFATSVDFEVNLMTLVLNAVFSVVFGFLLVMGIGAADMPVVISMLNSYSGFAIAALGWMLDNNLLIITGALIGSSGAILSYVMCKNMNRSFISVIVGGFGAEGGAADVAAEGMVLETTANEVAELLVAADAKRIVIVPDYGMAAARAAATVGEVYELLTAHGLEVLFGIHPVAGRMPGQMNVILAEAGVPYEAVKEIDDINAILADTQNPVDIALVIGANDTVNPSAKEAAGPLAGMPIIDVLEAKRVVVFKRGGTGMGYARVDNPLFTHRKTRILFGNAKDTLTDVLATLQQRARLEGEMRRHPAETFVARLEDARRQEADEDQREQQDQMPTPAKTLGVVRETTGNLIAVVPKTVYELLTAHGLEVLFGIHPVAGRMPGQMNVILAEAGVPYEAVKEIDDINAILADSQNPVDIALVIGANDTVNPSAKEAAGPLAGMPIIDVLEAKRVVVFKRGGTGMGYARVDNPLFTHRKTRMLFRNAKDTLTDVLATLQQRARLEGEMRRHPAETFIARLEDARRQEADEDQREQQDQMPTPAKTLGVVRETTGNLIACPRQCPSCVGWASLCWSRLVPVSRLATLTPTSRDGGLRSWRPSSRPSKGLTSSSRLGSTADEVQQMGSPENGQKVLVCMMSAARNGDLLQSLASRQITCIAVDEVPRTTAAQSMDVRSALSSLAGYRAVLEGFSALGALSGTSTFAVGRVDMAKVLVIGTGVAGLQAISTAKLLQADVDATDIRPDTKEQVESVGGKFIDPAALAPTPAAAAAGVEAPTGYATETPEELARAQKAMLERVLPSMDLVICSAARKDSAPLILDAALVRVMGRGKCIVDLTTNFPRSNCELARNDELVVDGASRVKVVGLSSPSDRMPGQASLLYSSCVANLLKSAGGAEGFSVQADADVRAMLVTHEGAVVYTAEQPPSPTAIYEGVELGQPTADEVQQMGSPENGQKVLVCMMSAARNGDLLQSLASRQITCIAVDEVPRTTAAQSMDVRSALSSLAGYRAVLEGFSALGALSGTSTFAAGRVDMAKVLVIGTGVAGLQAISTAKLLQADVYATDIRPDTKEQVESVGGKFIDPAALAPTPAAAAAGVEAPTGYATETPEELARAQKAMLERVLPSMDLVICSAARKDSAPLILDAALVRVMGRGKCIVDLTTNFPRSNCELARNDELVVDGASGVKIVGLSSPSDRMPGQASLLYSSCVANLLKSAGGAEGFSVQADADVRAMLVTHEGAVVYTAEQPPSPTAIYEGVEVAVEVPAEPAPEHPTATTIESVLKRLLANEIVFALLVSVGAVLFFLLGFVMDVLELCHMLSFTLAIIVGFFCVWSVTPALHTPLMSVTNAISGIVIVGSMIQLDRCVACPSSVCGELGILLASFNIGGGFTITTRMLQMFRAK